MNRVSNYYYDEKDKLTRVEVNETYESSDFRDGCEESVLLENAAEVTGEVNFPICMIAAVLSAIVLGVSIGKLLRCE